MNRARAHGSQVGLTSCFRFYHYRILSQEQPFRGTARLQEIHIEIDRRGVKGREGGGARESSMPYSWYFLRFKMTSFFNNMILSIL